MGTNPTDAVLKRITIVMDEQGWRHEISEEDTGQEQLGIMAWENRIAILETEEWTTHDQADDAQRKETCFNDGRKPLRKRGNMRRRRKGGQGRANNLERKEGRNARHGPLLMPGTLWGGSIVSEVT